MSRPLVVDTNVLLVANGSHEGAGATCRAACARALQRFHKDEHRIVLDDGWEILGEYRHKLRARGPGVGDRFLRWVYTNRANTARCEMVRITPRRDARRYEEFPDHPALAEFDPSDRKFVAVACAHPERPRILQASDSKWLGWAGALSERAVVVDFLCRDELLATRERKRVRRKKRRRR